jgi:hypothetical protein
MIEIDEMTEITSIAQYAEMSVASNLAPCPGCNVFHPPGENGGVCPHRDITPLTTEKEIQQQSLYRALRIRMDLMHDIQRHQSSSSTGPCRRRAWHLARSPFTGDPSR